MSPLTILHKREVRIIHKVGYLDDTHSLFLQSKILKFNDRVRWGGGHCPAAAADPTWMADPLLGWSSGVGVLLTVPWCHSHYKLRWWWGCVYNGHLCMNSCVYVLVRMYLHGYMFMLYIMSFLLSFRKCFLLPSGKLYYVIIFPGINCKFNLSKGNG